MSNRWGEVTEALFAIAFLLAAWVISAAAANDPGCAAPVLPHIPDWLERIVLLCDLV